MGRSLETYLMIHNGTSCAVSLSVSEIDNSDWDGVSRPDKNINGKRIEPIGEITKREEINYWNASHWYRITFKFDDGSKFSLRINQHWALESKYYKEFNEYDSNSEKYMKGIIRGKANDDPGHGKLRILIHSMA